tara:strand:- start:1444 stop:2013 length:570 start_codon:yes stop_codon:yes gene_type:complete
MKLIVGLGNPGNNYASTKHNFGFWIIDKLVETSSLKYKLGKGEYIFAKDEKNIFVKPTTFVNDSGLAVKQILNYYKLTIEQLIIIYDDIDLDLGNMRFKSSGSDAGHNGIKSIIYHAQSDVFDRLKIGIATDMNMRPSEQYVLKPFPKNYHNLVNQMIDDATNGIKYYLKNGIDKAMNNFNKRNNENGK